MQNFLLENLFVLLEFQDQGKSTLLFQTLYEMNRALNNSQSSPMKYGNSIEGMHLIDKVININQSPIVEEPQDQTQQLILVLSRQ